MTLARTAEELGWPDKNWIMEPPGAGPAVTAALAQKKVGPLLRDFEGAENAQVGLLYADPYANHTEAPLALVCEFTQPVPIKTLAHVHRLAWNFSRTPLLLTIDTERLRAFTCCEPPNAESDTDTLPAELTAVAYQFTDEGCVPSTIVDHASHALHWLELASGRLIKQNDSRFLTRYRADNLLLSNLHYLRRSLHRKGLHYDVIHDLIARIIFIQFLFDRRDSAGHTALNSEYLRGLYHSRILSQPYRTFPDLLANHSDCYSLFWYLDDHFNGDLFPGASRSIDERNMARNAESTVVRQSHLDLLREFVSGRLEMASGQYSLWPNYSFDIIPLEFISSIYEAFVKKKSGTVYTPAHLVDFVLDGILPWEGTDWNLKILDPACGSGIFLVKAFQRLIHRWKSTNPTQDIGSTILGSLLKQNLFGVDNDSHAIRTASFSLYLAMCDEIDPRHYWTQVRFPSLRDNSLLCRDFFDEDTLGIRTIGDSKSYDIVVGNAPWGKNTVTSLSKEWAKDHQWPISYGDIGPLFLAKSTALTKRHGQISLIQPASILLFRRSSNARFTRERIFQEYSVTEVVNFSALRFGLFKDAVGPAVLVTLRPERSADQPIQYVLPKPSCYSGSDDYRIEIDPYDVHEVSRYEALQSQFVWSALIWGGRRDVRLLTHFGAYKTLNKYKASGIVSTRQGIIRGSKTIDQSQILERRILESKDFPRDTFLEMSPFDLDINLNPQTAVRDSTNFAAFEPTQLIIKMSYTVDEQRFKAAVITPSTEGVLCTRQYVSVHAEQKYRAILDAACVSYNSAIAVYYLFLSSGRFANYRPEPYVRELLDVPIPEGLDLPLEEITSAEHLDKLAQELFKLRPAECALIEDALRYTLPDFKGDLQSPGRLPTRRGHTSREQSDLVLYCEWFLKILRAGFGSREHVCATVFSENSGELFPVRLVAFHFGLSRVREITEQPIGIGRLAHQLRNIYSILSSDNDGAIGYRRIARVFDLWRLEEEDIPTVLLVKPDEVRYWTRSVAMRDADEVSVEILQHMHHLKYSD